MVPLNNPSTAVSRYSEGNQIYKFQKGEGAGNVDLGIIRKLMIIETMVG